MSIDIEKLSAFLDDELTVAEAEEVRLALEQDEDVAVQLAALMMVDERVRQQTEAQNETPLPDTITRMLADEVPTNVIIGPWQKLRQQAQRHVAMAASVAMLIGLSGGVWFTSYSSATAEAEFAQAIERVLESQASGSTYAISESVSMTPQLTFKDQAGDYCRHYELYNAEAGQTTAAIECRRNGTWQPIAEATHFKTQPSGVYETASSQGMLDSVLDTIMATAPFSQATENAALNSHWNDEATIEE